MVVANKAELVAEQLLGANLNKKTWGDILYNVKVYGAKGDGIHDDTDAIRDTLAAAVMGGGGVVILPPGKYRITSKIIISGKALIIEGSGRGITEIIYQGPDGDAIEIQSNNCAVNNMSISRSGNPTSGAGIKVSNAATLCTFDNLAVVGFYYGMDFAAASAWNLSDSYIVNNIQYGVYIRNTISGDTGDQVIQGCTFDTGLSTPAAIRHESSGGVKIYGNKILHHQIGYDLQVADGVATSIAILDGNSIEMQTVRHVRLGRLGTTGNYSQIIISDNQHNISGSITEGVLVQSGVSIVQVTGNQSNGSNTTPYLNLTGGADINVDANQMNGWQTGVKIASGVNGVTVGMNAYKNVLKPIEDSTASTALRSPLIDHLYSKNFGATDAAVYTNLFRLDMASYRSCVFELTFEGILQGAASFGRHVKKVMKRDGAACALTDVHDINAGAVFDLQFDITTTSGSVIIGLRRNAAAGGSKLDGTATLRIIGHVQGVNIL